MSQLNSSKTSTSPKRSKKNKRKKIKYRKVAFKLTDAQRKALDHYCRIHNTTPVRFIKSLVNIRVDRYRDKELNESYVTPNQLSLFDMDDSEQSPKAKSG